MSAEGLLVADQVGLGKTPIGIAVGSRGPPALVLVPPHLQSQWRDEITKFLPEAKICLLRTVKKGRSPPAGMDFYVMSFHVASKWVEEFTKRNPVKSLVIDEVHGLRHRDTDKYRATAAIAEIATVRVGLAEPTSNGRNPIRCANASSDFKAASILALEAAAKALRESANACTSANRVVANEQPEKLRTALRLCGRLSVCVDFGRAAKVR